MDWQSILVIVVAAACAVWLVRQWLRPFLVNVPESDAECDGPTVRPNQELLQVLPPDE